MPIEEIDIPLPPIHDPMLDEYKVILDTAMRVVYRVRADVTNRPDGWKVVHRIIDVIDTRVEIHPVMVPSDFIHEMHYTKESQKAFDEWEPESGEPQPQLEVEAITMTHKDSGRKKKVMVEEAASYADGRFADQAEQRVVALCVAYHRHELQAEAGMEGVIPDRDGLPGKRDRNRNQRRKERNLEPVAKTTKSQSKKKSTKKK